MADLTLHSLKYADLLGKPLTKSVYRQLPRHDDVLIVPDGETFKWLVTMHGRVNWCPPGCEAATACECDYGECKRLPECRRLRPHQHLFIGHAESLWRGFTYLHVSEYDDFPMTERAWHQYEPLEQEATAIRDALSKLQQAMPSWGEWQARNETQRACDLYRKNVAVLEKQMHTIDKQARHEAATWQAQALAALPVILLR